MTLSRPLLECLMRVRNLDEFRPLREYLATENEKHTNFLIGCNEDRPMHVAQGMLRATKGLTDLIDSAPVLLDKERRPQQAG